MSPVFEGSVTRREHGVVDCTGPCLISHAGSVSFSRSELIAWAFMVISQNGEELPQISFGLKDDTKDIICFDYFKFLSSSRQAFTVAPFSIDGLGCALRFLVDQGRVSIYACDTCVYRTSVTGSGRFFVRVSRGECSIMTCFDVDQRKAAWFPSMSPVRWRTKDSTLLLRGSHIRKVQSENVALTCAFTSAGVKPIPGTNVLYFEVRCDYVNSLDEAQPSGVAIGFSPSIGPFQGDEPGAKDRSIGFSTRNGKLTAGPNETTSTGFPPVKIGDVLGIGLHMETGRLFVALNGSVVDSDYRLETVSEEMHAVVGLISTSDECTVNFGKKPFLYEVMNPPPGWALFEPETTSLWSRGPDVYCHIEGYYRDLGVQNLVGVMVGKKPLGLRDRFEVTVEMASSKEQRSCTPRTAEKVGCSIGVGFPECLNSREVIYESGCLVVGSGSGDLYDGEHEKSQTFRMPQACLQHADCSPDGRRENRTIGFGRNGNDYEFSVGDKSFEFTSRQENLQNYPIFTWRDMTYLFINCGQVPFVKGYENDGDVELFNHIKVQMSDEGLAEFGLMKDDIVESRDRLFFGKVAGLYKGRPFFIVPGISGAVCLNSTDPLFHRILLRVVSRPRVEKFWTPCLTLDGVDRVNVGHGLPYPPTTLFCCPFGVSLFLGCNQTGNCIVRRVSDLITSSNAVVLGKGDEVQRMVVGPQGEKFRDIECSWFKPGAQLWPLDVTVPEATSLCVVIGYRGDRIIGHDGNKLIEIGPKATPVFRFIGYDRGVDVKGQFPRSSVSVASFLSAGVTAFSNEMCGVYGLHVIVNQSEKFLPWQCHSFPLPPYVDKIFKSLLGETIPQITHIELDPVEVSDVFYDCTSEDDPSKPNRAKNQGVMVTIDQDNPRPAAFY